MYLSKVAEEKTGRRPQDEAPPPLPPINETSSSSTVVTSPNETIPKAPSKTHPSAASTTQKPKESMTTPPAPPPSQSRQEQQRNQLSARSGGYGRGGGRGGRSIATSSDLNARDEGDSNSDDDDNWRRTRHRIKMTQEEFQASEVEAETSMPSTFWNAYGLPAHSRQQPTALAGKYDPKPPSPVVHRLSESGSYFLLPISDLTLSLSQRKNLWPLPLKRNALMWRREQKRFPRQEKDHQFQIHSSFLLRIPVGMAKRGSPRTETLQSKNILKKFSGTTSPPPSPA
jgi:hypothetical protein